MALNTPNRGYPYPQYGDVNNAPTQIQAFATAVDTDMFNNIRAPRLEAEGYSSCRVIRDVGTQAIANNTSVTLTYTVETYDNDGMANLGVNNTIVTITTPGVYLLGGSVNMQPDGSATGAAALIFASNGGVVQNPVGSSRDLHATRQTSISGTTLHQVLVGGEQISMFVRHNHGAGLNATLAQLSVTRIA